MNKSIRKQVTTIFIGLVVAIMLVAVFVNSQFLVHYYIYNKQSTLIDVYEKMEHAVENTGASYDGMAEELNEVVEVSNITLLILSSDGQRRIESTNERQAQAMTMQLKGYILRQIRGEILETSDNYQICSTSDVLGQTEYIEMWGNLSDGSWFLIRSPLESIKESVMLSTRFMIYTMLVVAILGCVFVWYFSRKITNPILELATLSKRDRKSVV